MAVQKHKKQRAEQKIQVFTDILEKISTLSTSSRLKVSCIILKKDFTKMLLLDTTETILMLLSILKQGLKKNR